MARTRSPNYPYIGLPAAIDRVRKIFGKENRNRMSREVVAKHSGYGSLNGISLSVISALGKFGLLESVDSDLRVADDAVTILVDPAGSPEKIMALRRAALKPDLFSELHKHFGAQLPSETNLVAHLQKKGFTGTAAAQAAKSYRETMELVSRETGAYSGGEQFPKVGDGANGMPPDPQRDSSKPNGAPAPLNQGERQLCSFQLSPQTTVRVLLTGPSPGPKEIGNLIKLLEMQKGMLTTSEKD